MSKPPIIFSPRWWRMLWMIVREFRRGMSDARATDHALIVIDTQDKADYWARVLSRSIRVGDKIEIGKPEVSDA
jgi:hypothetical protein